jgi:flavin-binding protein dodecin
MVRVTVTEIGTGGHRQKRCPAGVEENNYERRQRYKDYGSFAASVTKITAASPKSFDDAIHSGIERASKTLRDITGFHVLEEKAKVVKGQISEYRVTMEITFVLENS